MRPPRNVNSWVWFINGLLLVVLLGFSSARIVLDWFDPGYDYMPDGLDVVKDSSNVGQLRAVRFDPPLAVYGSQVELIPVRYGDDYLHQPMGASSIADAMDIPAPSDDMPKPALVRGYVRRPLINIIIKPVNGTGRLLLEKRAFINLITYPIQDPDGAQPWLSYEIAFEDLDGDGRLTGVDCRGLYISDLDGKAFHRVLSEDYRVIWHRPSQTGNAIHIHALDTKGFDSSSMGWDTLPQRALIHDLGTGDTRPDETLQDLVTEAASLVSP